MGSCGCLAYTNVLEDRGDEWRQSFSRWAASQTVAAWSEKPGSLASKVDGKGSDGTGTVRKVNALLPALGPMAIG